MREDVCQQSGVNDWDQDYRCYFWEWWVRVCFIQLFRVWPFCFQKWSLSGGTNIRVSYFIYCQPNGYSLYALLSDQVEAVVHVVEGFLECFLDDWWAVLVKLLYSLLLLFYACPHYFNTNKRISIRAQPLNFLPGKLTHSFTKMRYYNSMRFFQPIR